MERPVQGIGYNLLMNLYDASKPEIFERGWANDKFAPICYINGLFCNQIDDEKLNRAKARMAHALDNSVSAVAAEDQARYGIYKSKVIDLIAQVGFDLCRECPAV